jgi:hypothetical protein
MLKNFRRVLNRIVIFDAVVMHSRLYVYACRGAHHADNESTVRKGEMKRNRLEGPERTPAA